MSNYRAYSLKRIVDISDRKRKLVSLAQYLPKATFEDVKQILSSVKKGLFDNPKDQTIIAISEIGNGKEFDDIKEMLAIIKELGMPSMLTPVETFLKIKKALDLSKVIDESHLENIERARIKHNTRLTKKDKEIYEHQSSKCRTFIRYFQSQYDKAKEGLRPIAESYAKADDNFEDLKEIIHTPHRYYEQQKARPLSDREIIHFIEFYPGKAEKIGLDDKAIVSKMLSDLKLKPFIDKAINAVQRGKLPRARKYLLSISDSQKEIRKKFLENNMELFEADESKAKEMLQEIKDEQELEELAKQEWSQEMRKSKEEKAQKRIEDELLEEKINQRNKEHDERLKLKDLLEQQKLQEQMLQEESDKNKYSHLTVKNKTKVAL